MKISDVAIRNPVFTWMLMAALILFGAITFREMGVSQLPDVDFPVVNISVTLEGAAPEVIETTVVDPIEDSVMSVQGITKVSSSSRTGSGNISLEFDLSKNIDVAVQEVQTRMAQVQRRLPEDVEPPVVSKTNPEDQPIMWLSVSNSSMQTNEFMAFVRDHLKDQFSTVSGVGEVFLGGYVDPSLRVWVSGKKLSQYYLTVDDITSTILSEHSELPAGRIETREKEFNIRTLGEAKSVEEFGKIVINRRGGAPNYSPIYLDQVAEIEDGLADVRRKSRVMGKPAVGLGIRKQRGSNAVEVGKAVMKKMEEVKPQLPKGIEMGVNFDGTRFIKESVEELNFTLLLSGLLTAIVCWLFLGSWTATVNIVLAIPTSIVGSFILLGALGFTLNTFTLLGLSLAIGIVVDDAIMVLENIVRHREKGEGKLEAAVIGAREIGFAAMAATVAIIAIFLPVAFMKGIIGKYFFQFGVTISIAVALSLFEALTLTPMRCSQFLQVDERTSKLGHFVDKVFERLAAAYARVLPGVLNKRWLVILTSILFFAASLIIVKFLRKEFVPAQDTASLIVRSQTPEGSSIEVTDEKMKQLEAALSARPEVIRYFQAIGGFGGGDVNTGMTFVTFAPHNQRAKDPASGKVLTQQELSDVLRKDFGKIPGIVARIQDPSLAGFGGGRSFPIDFSIRGPDWEKLAELTKLMMAEMEKLGTLADIDTNFRGGMPEVQVLPDRAKAKQYGVSLVEINKTINALIGGTVAGKYTRDGRRYDIRLRLLAEERSTSDDIKRLNVRNNRGELVPLGNLVTITEKESLQSISRENRERAISVYSNIKSGVSQADAIQKVRDVATKLLPEGYYLVEGGSSKTFAESFQSLIFALVLGLIVSYMVLASQFNSYADPVTVLMALPFSVSGAFIFLLLGNQSINIYSMIGLILLMGIVKKNSILLVDFTNQVRDTSKKGIREALIEACPVRLRPILMTSVATVVGAIPPALAIGPGAETRVPMALAVIGGVIVSTILTLFVVPCVYSLISSKNRRPREAI